MRIPNLLAVVMAATLLVAAPARAETGDADERLMARILELRAEIDRLTARLSPAARARLERLLAEAGAPATGDPAGEDDTPAAADPQPGSLG